MRSQWILQQVLNYLLDGTRMSDVIVIIEERWRLLIAIYLI